MANLKRIKQSALIELELRLKTTFYILFGLVFSLALLFGSREFLRQNGLSRYYNLLYHNDKHPTVTISEFRDWFDRHNSEYFTGVGFCSITNSDNDLFVRCVQNVKIGGRFQ